MKKRQIAKRLIKLAKELLSYKSQQNSVADLTNVDEVLIVITNESLEFDATRLASRPRITRYSIEEVRQLLSLKTPRFEFKKRDDGLNRPERLMMTEKEALDVIAKLSVTENYSKDLSLNFPDTDVYTVDNYKRLQVDELINLYIKIAVVDKGVNRRVLVISFHEKGLV